MPPFEQTQKGSHYAILYTKFQASEPSGSETEDFFHTFLCISMLQTQEPLA